MTRFLLSLVLVCLLTLPAAAENRRTIRHNPDREVSAPVDDRSTWQWVPRNLDDAHEQLERLLPKEELERIDAMKSEDEMIRYQRNLGQTLRNEWGLWKGSRLSQAMNQLGFRHPDDSSGVILETFWAKRHNQDFRLEERKIYFEEYWKAYAPPPKSAVDPKDGSDIEWNQILNTGTDKHPGAVHVGRSKKSGRLLTYEFDKGVSLPSAELLKRLQNKPGNN